MTELSDNASGSLSDWPHTNISAAELAALDDDAHAGSTRRHNPGECRECMEVFRAVRRHVAAARPVIEEEEQARLDAGGRLLPEGGRFTETFWGLRHRPDGVENVGAGSGSEYLARKAAASGDGQLVRKTVRTWPDGSQLFGAWLDVEHFEESAEGYGKGRDDEAAGLPRPEGQAS